jgi:Transposase IS66 family
VIPYGMAGSRRDVDDLSGEDLKKLVLRLLEENAALKAEIAALREEVLRLKGLKGRPRLRPSGMEPATDGKAKDGTSGKRRGRGAQRMVVTEERVITIDAPAGSRFKGYETTVVQDLVVRPITIRYRRERWRTPDGETIVAPLPPGVRGHVGPELRRTVLALYHQGRMTVPGLLAHLHDLGVELSKRQLGRLLIAGQDGFVDESRDVLRAGLETAAWISADDTGARHKGRNGTCTRIGNDDFAWFATTGSKSRLNFLDLLRAGHDDYAVNGAALAFMRRHHLAGPLIARLAADDAKHFADAAAWTAHLRRLGLGDLKVTPDPVRVATEGALWGSIVDHGLLNDAVILSDDAGQFNVGRHALCWVHAERLIHKLDTFNDRQRRAVMRIRARVWRLYDDLKAYRRRPSARRKAELARRFDALFTTCTGFVSLDRLLRRLHANKDELLAVLDRPDIPLNTNGAENDIRCQVTRRKVSAGTRSDAGRDCRDTFLGLMKTCRKLGLSFWSYLGSRLHVPNAPAIPPLPDLVRAKASPT